LSVTIGYDEPLAHQIYAGSDFYLMPSRTEPCGLSQMYAMIYGAVPIVHKTGGLADTVTDATSKTIANGSATGIVFSSWTERAFLNAFNRSERFYRDPDTLAALRRNAMRQDFSWNNAAKQYVQLFREAMAAP